MEGVMRKKKRKDKLVESKVQKIVDTLPSWKEILDKHNGGHSTTIFGIIVDSNGNPITGRL